MPELCANGLTERHAVLRRVMSRPRATTTGRSASRFEAPQPQRSESSFPRTRCSLSRGLRSRLFRVRLKSRLFRVRIEQLERHRRRYRDFAYTEIIGRDHRRQAAGGLAAHPSRVGTGAAATVRGHKNISVRPGPSTSAGMGRPERPREFRKVAPASVLKKNKEGSSFDLCEHPPINGDKVFGFLICTLTKNELQKSLDSISFSL